MMTFKLRRARASVVTLAIMAISIPVLLAFEISLHDSSFLTGWTLLALVAALALLNGRKKLTYPPLFRAASWLQFHIYAGYLSIVLFFFHTQWQLPDGPFETMLYCVFMFLALSGLVGLYLSRSIPTSLADRGNEVIYERIPAFRRQLSDQAQALVLRSIEEHDSTILSDFYTARLATYMSQARNYWAHLIRSERPKQLMLHDLSALYRYLNSGEREIADELKEIINLKDDLDFHYVRQGLLKTWLFVHIPLTYVLILFLVAHVILAYAFAGVVN